MGIMALYCSAYFRLASESAHVHAKGMTSGSELQDVGCASAIVLPAAHVKLFLGESVPVQPSVPLFSQSSAPSFPEGSETPCIVAKTR